MRHAKVVEAAAPASYKARVKAAVLHGREDVRIEDVPEPALRAGEVRVAIRAALTCGTDLKVFKRGGHPRMIQPPALFGHELAGVICETGEGVTDWAIGDRVVPANSAPCGECFHCRNAQENLCDDLLFLNGAYAERIVIPARIVQRNLHRLRPQTAFADAALAEPLACVVQGVEESRLRAGQHVLVIGSGPIGIMFTCLAKNLGCRVTLAGRGAPRLQVARRLGADAVVEVSGDNVVEATSALRPFDVVIEAVGTPQTWEAATRLVRKGGTVNFFGGCATGTTITLDTERLHYASLSLQASFHHTPRAFRRALEFIEGGTVRAADFVDGECALDELPALFARMSRGQRAIKTLVRTAQAT